MGAARILAIVWSSAPVTAPVRFAHPWAPPVSLLHHPTSSDGIDVVLWELLAADVESVEGVGAIGAMLEQVLLGLRVFLLRLVLAEAVAATFHASRLDGEDEVVVVLSVEERHETLLAGEALVDEQVLLIVAHGVAEIDIDDLPSVSLELMLHHPVEVLVIDGIVAAQGGGVVVEHDGVVAVGCIVTAEVVDECRQFPLVLHVERLQDIQAVADGLATDYPVDVGIVVHAIAERSILDDISISKTRESLTP